MRYETYYRNKNLILLLFSVIYILWHFFYLDKYPLPNPEDDIRVTEPIWRMFNGKGFSSEMFKNVYNLERSNVWHGRLHSLFHFPLLIFGLGIFQARLSSLLASFIVLIFTFLIAKKILNSKIGLLSIYGLCLSYSFINLSHRVRQEMPLVCFMLAAFYLFIVSQNSKYKNSKFLLFGCGFISSLSLDIHLNGIIVVLLFYFLMALKIVSKDNNKKSKNLVIYEIIWYTFGVSFGVIWYFLTHILLDPDTFFTQFYNFIVSKEVRPGITKITSILDIPKKLFYDYFNEYWQWTGAHRGVFELLLILSIITYSVVKMSKIPEVKYVLSSVVFIYISIPLVSRSVVIDYALIFYPFVFILFGYIVSTIYKEQLRQTVIVIYFVYSLIMNFIPISLRYAKVNYDRYAKKVLNFIPEDAKIFGDTPIWFVCPDRWYHHCAYYILRNIKNQKLKDFLKERNVTYLVLAEEDFKMKIEHNILYRKDFLELQIEFVGEVLDPYFGAKSSYCPLHKFHTTKIFKVID